MSDGKIVMSNRTLSATSHTLPTPPKPNSFTLKDLQINSVFHGFLLLFVNDSFLFDSFVLFI